jgi:hypothetical protein
MPPQSPSSYDAQPGVKTLKVSFGANRSGRNILQVAGDLVLVVTIAAGAIPEELDLRFPAGRNAVPPGARKHAADHGVAGLVNGGSFAT